MDWKYRWLDRIEQVLKNISNRLDYQIQGRLLMVRSDYGPFIQAGIPSGGLFTGAETVMTESQASEYGGRTGVAYDMLSPSFDTLPTSINRLYKRW